MVNFDDKTYLEFAKIDPDVQLMLRVQADDHQAFEQLYQRHAAPVEQLIGHLMGNRQSAEDLTQEVFLRVFRARKNYQPTAKFTTWLFTITRNVAFKARRSSSRRRDGFFVISETDLGQDASLDESVTSNDSPSRRLEHCELSSRVRGAVSRLNDRQREVVSMYYLDEHSYSDVAGQMQSSPHAIKSLLHRARTNLRDSLAPHNRDGILAVSN